MIITFSKIPRVTTSKLILGRLEIKLFTNIRDNMEFNEYNNLEYIIFSL